MLEVKRARRGTAVAIVARSSCRRRQISHRSLSWLLYADTEGVRNPQLSSTLSAICPQKPLLEVLGGKNSCLGPFLGKLRKAFQVVSNHLNPFLLYTSQDKETKSLDFEWRSGTLATSSASPPSGPNMNGIATVCLLHINYVIGLLQ